MNIIPVRNTLGWSAVVFFACEVILLFCVVFFVFSAGPKFDFRVVINGTLKKWHASGEKILQWYRPVFLIGYICFAWPSSQMTIPTLWRPTAYSWIRVCDLSLSTCRNYWNPFCSLIRRVGCLFGAKIECPEYSLVLTSFILCSLNLNMFCGCPCFSGEQQQQKYTVN